MIITDDKNSGLNLDHCYEIAKNCECGDIAQFDCNTGHLSCLTICDLAARLRSECPEDCTSFFALCEVNQACQEGTIPYVEDCDNIVLKTPCDLAEIMKNNGCLKQTVDCADVRALISNGSPELLEISQCQGGLITFTVLEQEDQDELVAVAEGCEPGYLYDQIEVVSNCMRKRDFEDGDCKVYIEDIPCDELDDCSCCKKIHKKIRMTRNVLAEQDAGPNGTVDGSGFYLLSAFTPEAFGSLDIDSISGGVSTREIEHNFGGGGVDDIIALAAGYFCNYCEDPRLFDIKFKGNIEASRGVNGLRIELYKVCPDGTFAPIADWRDSPISDPDLVGLGAGSAPDGLPDNYEITSAGGQGLSQGYKYHERQNFDASEKVRLDPGCCVYPVLKVSSVNDDPAYDASFPAQVGILGKLTSDGSVSGDRGAFIEITSCDDCCMIEEYKEQCNC